MWHRKGSSVTHSSEHCNEPYSFTIGGYPHQYFSDYQLLRKDLLSRTAVGDRWTWSETRLLGPRGTKMCVVLKRLINATRMGWTVQVASMQTQEVHYFNSHKVPLTSSPEHVIGLHPKPAESSQHAHILFCQIHFNIIFAITRSQALRVVPFFAGLSG